MKTVIAIRTAARRRAPAAAAVALSLLAGCGGGRAGDDTVAAAATSADPTSGAAASAGPTPETRVPVVTSTNVYGDIVSRIGGAYVTVTSLIGDPGQDPHSFEANPRNQLAVAEARLVVANGGGYDDFVSTMVAAHEREGRQVLDAVDLSGRTPPPDGELNEHVWYDFAAVDELAGRIADALAAADPGHAGVFRANRLGFSDELRTLSQRADALKTRHGGTEVAVTEPVPLYLLEACGLVNVSPEEFSEAIEEGTDVPVAVLQEAVDVLEDGSAKALVYNEQTSGPQTERLREAAAAKGVPVVAVTETLPEGKSYVTWMTANLDALEHALGGATPTATPGP